MRTTCSNFTICPVCNQVVWKDNSKPNLHAEQCYAINPEYRKDFGEGFAAYNGEREIDYAKLNDSDIDEHWTAYTMGYHKAKMRAQVDLQRSGIRGTW